MADEISKRDIENLSRAIQQLTNSLSRTSPTERRSYISDKSKERLEREDKGYREKRYRELDMFGMKPSNESQFSKVMLKEIDKLRKYIKIDDAADLWIQQRQVSKNYKHLESDIDNLRKNTVKTALYIRALSDDNIVRTAREELEVRHRIIQKLKQEGSYLTSSYLDSIQYLADLQNIVVDLGSDMSELSEALDDVKQSSKKYKGSQEQQVKSLLQVINRLNDLSKTSKTLAHTHDKFTDLLQKSNKLQEKIDNGEKVSQKEIESIRSELNKEITENINNHSHLSTVLRKSTRINAYFQSIIGKLNSTLEEKFNKKLVGAGSYITAFLTALGTLTATIYSSVREYQAAGMGPSSFDGYIDRIIQTVTDSLATGLSDDEYKKLVLENARTTVRTTVNENDQPLSFNRDTFFADRQSVIIERLKVFQDEASKFGISLKSSGDAFNEMVDNLQMTGIDVNDRTAFESAIRMQTQLFNKLRVGTQLTVKEFANLQKELIESGETQNILVGLNIKERQQRLVDFTLATQMLKLKSLELPIAKELVKNLIAQQRATVGERFSKSANIMAVGSQLSALGMSDSLQVAQQLSQLYRSGKTDSETLSVIADLEKEIVRMRNEAANTAFESGNLSQQLVVQSINDNLKEIIDDNKVKTYNAMELGSETKQITETQQEQGELSATLSQNAKNVNTLVELVTNGFSQLSGLLGGLLGAVGAMGGILAIGIAKGIMNSSSKQLFKLEEINKTEQESLEEIKKTNKKLDTMIKQSSKVTPERERKKYTPTNKTNDDYQYNKKENNRSNRKDSYKDIVISNDNDDLHSIRETVKDIYRLMLKCGCNRSLGGKGRDVDIDLPDKDKKDNKDDKKKKSLSDKFKSLFDGDSKLSKATKIGGTALGVGLAGYAVYDIYNNQDLSDTEKTNDIVNEGVKTAISGIGAFLGSSLGPLGFMAGGYLGNEIADSLLGDGVDYVGTYKEMVDFLGNSSSIISDISTSVKDTTSSAYDYLKDKISSFDLSSITSVFKETTSSAIAASVEGIRKISLINSDIDKMLDTNGLPSTNNDIAQLQDTIKHGNEKLIETYSRPQTPIIVEQKTEEKETNVVNNQDNFQKVSESNTVENTSKIQSINEKIEPESLTSLLASIDANIKNLVDLQSKVIQYGRLGNISSSPYAVYNDGNSSV